MKLKFKKSVNKEILDAINREIKIVQDRMLKEGPETETYECLSARLKELIDSRNALTGKGKSNGEMTLTIIKVAGAVAIAGITLGEIVLLRNAEMADQGIILGRSMAWKQIPKIQQIKLI